MASFQQPPHASVGVAGASPGGAGAAADEAAAAAAAAAASRLTKTGTRVLAVSGVLSNLHARAHAAAYGGPGGADFDRLFRAHSPNGDGHLTRLEWHDLLRKTFKMTVEELDDAQLSTLFSRLDKRNAGVLSLAQLMRYFDPQSSRVDTDEQGEGGEEVKVAGGTSPQATSISMLRRGLESTSLNDEQGPHMHGALNGGGTRGAAADDLAEPSEDSWHGMVYHRERDTAYDLAAMVAQLREYDTAIAQTQKANDVLHRALRNRDAAREEEKRQREEEKRHQPLRSMLENMPEGLKLERAPWRGNFNFKSPGETINEMAKTAKRETAAASSASLAATPVAPQRLF